MKTLTSTAIVALTAGIIGIAGIAPSMAQQSPTPQAEAPQGQMQNRMHQKGNGQRPDGMRHHMQNRGEMRGNMRGGLLALVCSEKGAERLDVAFTRLTHRVELTAEQQPLFDDLKATALSAQTSFADTCAASRPTADATTTPDPVAGMTARIAVDKARIAALETVLPKFDAFFSSLTDDQKASVAPKRSNRGPDGDDRQGNRRGGPQHHGMADPQTQTPGADAPDDLQG